MVGRALLFLSLLAASATAEPLRPQDVPEPLRPWVEWALHGHEEARCTSLLGEAERRECAWPSELTLGLDELGGTFTQQWDVQRGLWVPLPGAAKQWPQAVVVDGAAAVVIAQGGVPQVWLERGRHTVGGRFEWDRLPETLSVPARTGLVSLRVRGRDVAFPDRDADGRLWLERREAPDEQGDRVSVIVHRLLDDDIPLQLQSQVQLDVSGKGREVLLGPVLPADFVPMAIDSPLPARLEPDGRLRMQVRAGRWNLRIAARRDTPSATVVAPTPTDVWASSEVWVFDAHPNLRLVNIEGADAIDPQQTDLPGEWRQLPAYLMRPGSEMRLVERRRGDADGAPDQLALQRTLWLDFDGGGYTIHDLVSGTLTRNWRLDMAPPIVLGRVAVGGADQFITRLDAQAPPGVEIRVGQLDLDADGRLDGARRILPVIGWTQDFQSVSGELQLPPGWRLLHATGVDQARPTWIATWTLLDLFVVLITALATARLFGWRWGALALVGLGLSYTENDAPRMIWLAVLATEALVRVVPEGWARRTIRLARVLALAALVVFALPFLIGQIRQAIYPALEQPGRAMQAGDQPTTAVAPEPAQERLRALGYREMDKGLAVPPVAKQAMRSARSFEHAGVDPRSIVQTGPGLPTWSWNAVSLEWSGPVDRDQQLHLFLLPPAVNLLLAFIRTALLALFVARLVGVRRNALRGGAVLMLLVVAGGAPVASADYPSAEMLDELRARLLEPPACYPSCASLPRMRLEVDEAGLRARLRVDVGAATAVPLPGHAQQWLPRTVLVDGKPADALLQDADGGLWVRLDLGSHEVLIEGPLPGRDTVQLRLPLAPQRVESQVSGWTLDGLRSDGSAEPNLQLTRTVRPDGAQAAPLQPSQLPPFVRVERTLRLGLTWQVETRVVRLTPLGAALVLAVPLLAGESVTTAAVSVVDDRVQLNLPPQSAEVSWESTLAERSPIELRAPESVPWVEVWTVDASPIWHLDASGIAPVLREAGSSAAQREWRPWPGETVTVAVVRPEGVAGQTLTIDDGDLEASPGIRATDVALTLQVRSSRGAQHAITLPEDAELLSVSIGGDVQPLRQQEHDVVLPIAPGPQRVEMHWRQSAGIAAYWRSPAVDLKVPSVNVHLSVAVPPNRWVLFAGGPSLGPAVLFWSLLPVLVLAAGALGRVRSTPLHRRDWFLLGIGLTQVPAVAAVAVAAWLLVLGWRRTHGERLGARAFDALQLAIIAWTVVALSILLFAVQQGLLGQPEMQIAGNGSSADVLRWYQDRSAALLPQAWVFSAPLLVYRLLMLAWALWLAQALLRWLQWGWETLATGGYWRPLRRPKPVKPAPSQ